MNEKCAANTDIFFFFHVGVQVLSVYYGVKLCVQLEIWNQPLLEPLMMKFIFFYEK